MMPAVMMLPPSPSPSPPSSPSGGRGGDSKLRTNKKAKKTSTKTRQQEQEQHKLVESLSYETLDSDVYRAYLALDRYNHRGSFWNSNKHGILVRYFLTACVGIAQGLVAYMTNVVSLYIINKKFDHANDLLERNHTFWAFVSYLFAQTCLAAMASMFVWIEPVSAGSGTCSSC